MELFPRGSEPALIIHLTVINAAGSEGAAGGVLMELFVRLQQHPLGAAAVALPLRSRSSSMPDVQTEAGATILKHTTA